MQKVKSKRGDKVYHTWLVKESFRTPEGPRSRTIANITNLPPEIRELIRLGLKGQSFIAEDELQLIDALDFGGLAVLRHACAEVGLDQALEAIKDERCVKLIKAMIFSRILSPSSKLALKDRAAGTALAQACGLAADEAFDEDDLYRAMDALNGQWAGLEKSLYQSATGGDGSSLSLVLYDLTSVYFEGKGPQHMAQYGYSRDHRGDRPQVLLAVATDAQGTPLHLEVLRGNRADNSTLQGLLATLRRRFGLREVVFSFDGGMSSRFNLEAMEEAELQYVTRQSDATLRALIKELPADNQPELWDRTQLLDVEIDGRRYVIAGSPWRAQRDAERRQARITAGQTELQRLQAVVARRKKKPCAQKLASQIGRTLARLKAHKYFSYQVEDDGRLSWQLKADIVKAESDTDGFYLLGTNLPADDHSPQQVHAHYKT